MLYRYRMHWFADPLSPHGPSRPLFSRTPADAISHAADLWQSARAYARALGYCVLDTEDGSVLYGSTGQATEADKTPGEAES